jgi:hypothetical protein
MPSQTGCLACRHDRRFRSGMLSAFIASYRYARNPSATRLILGSAVGSAAGDLAEVLSLVADYSILPGPCRPGARKK